MCGVVGFCDFRKKTSYRTLQQMTEVIAHRGPDDHGCSYHQLDSATVGLGHRRLSILDLSSGGHQPMQFKNLEIVYNGEIYNFKEIRVELEELDYTFTSQSDTEVILKAYDAWGLKAIDRFNGMFAIAIYDKIKQELILIRDRSGVKPCYWYWDENLFLFGSELKSFHCHPRFKKEINQNALALYLQYGYILQPHTIFNSCYKLRAGHHLTVDIKNKTIVEEEYWSIITLYQKPKLELSDGEATRQVESLLHSAFEYRMISDVPVGMFLSGGYDSSTVTAILQANSTKKLNTFTIGFKENGYDEAPYAKEVAKRLGTDHTEYYCTQKDALEIIPKLAEIYDEPFGGASAIPSILVSQLAKEKVSVSLSADGADELFAGYVIYENILNHHQKFSKIPPFAKSLLASGMRRIPANKIPFSQSINNFERYYKKIRDILDTDSCGSMLKNYTIKFSHSEINHLLLHKIKPLQTLYDKDVSMITSDSLEQMLVVHFQTHMRDNILAKVDRATMHCSLEGREPFLDHRLIELVAQLPSQMKYRNGEKKWLLKEINHKYLPKSLMNRPKMSFAIPIVIWFRDELKPYLYHYLNQERLEKEGIFNTREVISMRDRYINGDNGVMEKIWFILIFEMWYEKWM